MATPRKRKSMDPAEEGAEVAVRKRTNADSLVDDLVDEVKGQAIVDGHSEGRMPLQQRGNFGPGSDPMGDGAGPPMNLTQPPSSMCCTAQGPLQEEIRELQMQVEEEQRQKEDLREQLLRSERRAQILQSEKEELVRQKHSPSPDWLRIFGGPPALPVILSHLDRSSIRDLRLSCKMLGGMDSLRLLGFAGTLTLRVKRHPEDEDLYFHQRHMEEVHPDDRKDFEALGRVATLVKVIIFEIASQRLVGSQLLALIQPLPPFPKVWKLECDIEWYAEYMEHGDCAEAFLAFARLMPSVSVADLDTEWALIPGLFGTQLLSLWPQIEDVRIEGRMNGRHPGPQTLLTAAASRGILTSLILDNEGGEDEPLFLDMSPLISNNHASLRALNLHCGITVSSVDLTALFGQNALEELILAGIVDQRGQGIMSSQFLVALASVTSLKHLALGGGWNCDALDIVHFFQNAKFWLHVLLLYGCPYTAALPQAIAGTQTDLGKVVIIIGTFVEGEPTTVDKSALEALPKVKDVRLEPFGFSR